MTDEAILALIRERKYLNQISRIAGVSSDRIHRVAHAAGVSIAKAPQSAYGRHKVGKAVPVVKLGEMTQEQHWRGAKFNARWIER